MMRSAAVLLGCVLASGAIASAEESRSVDSMELASGLTLRGKLAEPKLRVTTVLGELDLSSDAVQTLVCLPPLRTTQVLWTRDGDVLVGKLTVQSLHFTTDDGNAAELKLSQISRLVRSPTMMPATKPAAADLATLYTLDGDQVNVAAPEVIEFSTRIGTIKAKSNWIDQIIFDDSAQAAHRIHLRDGSSLSGFVVDDPLTVRAEQLTASDLKVRVATVRRFEFSSSAAVVPAGPRLELLGGDVLLGALQGELTLQTELGSTAFEADKIERLAPVPEHPGELALTLRDGRTVTGTSAKTIVQCALGCGAKVSVPVEMIAGYVKAGRACAHLSAMPDRSRGLSARGGGGGGDGAFTVGEQGAARCWQEPNNNYLYFAIDDKVRPQTSGGDAEVQIEYFDAGTGEFQLEYDSIDASLPLNGAYKTHPDMIHRADSGRWHTARWSIADARFSGAQNMHADFRLHYSGDGPLLIRQVRLRRGIDKAKQ